MATLPLRVFVSSLGDVSLERLCPVPVLERLHSEFVVVDELMRWVDLPLPCSQGSI